MEVKDPLSKVKVEATEEEQEGTFVTVLSKEKVEVKRIYLFDHCVFCLKAPCDHEDNSTEVKLRLRLGSQGLTTVNWVWAALQRKTKRDAGDEEEDGDVFSVAGRWFGCEEITMFNDIPEMCGDCGDKVGRVHTLLNRVRGVMGQLRTGIHGSAEQDLFTGFKESLVTSELNQRKLEDTLKLIKNFRERVEVSAKRGIGNDTESTSFFPDGGNEATEDDPASQCSASSVTPVTVKNEVEDNDMDTENGPDYSGFEQEEDEEGHHVDVEAVSDEENSVLVLDSVDIQGDSRGDPDHLRSEQAEYHKSSESSDDENSEEDDDVIPTKRASIQTTPKNREQEILPMTDDKSNSASEFATTTKQGGNDSGAKEMSWRVLWKKEGSCFICTLCDQKHYYKNMKIHLRLSHNIIEKEPIDTCDLCKIKLPRREMLDHLKEHVGKEYLTRCPNPECGFMCITQELLELHLSQNALCQNTLDGGLKGVIKSSRTCLECGKYTASLPHLRRHLLQEHETPEKNHPCPISGCGVRFTLRQNLVHHLRIHQVPEPVDTQLCFKCTKKTRILFEEMEAHLKEKHGAEQVIKCNKCPFLFSSCDELMYHTVSKHRNGGLSCDICEDKEMSFSNPAQLQKHYFMDHNIGKQFQCGACPKVFLTIRSLNNHKRTNKNCNIKLKHENTLMSHQIRKHEATTHALPIEGRRKRKENDQDLSEISDDHSSEDEDVIPTKRARIQASPENQSTMDSCDLCKLKLPRSEMLDHLKNHVGKHYLTRCPNSDCGFVCIPQELLEKHLRHNTLCQNTLEEGLEGFMKSSRTCSECSEYTGSRLRDFRRHLLEEHETPEKNHTCPISGCGVRYTLSQNLVHHLRVHEVPEPVDNQRCLKCKKKKEIGVEEMEAHLKEEHGAEQVVKCRKCPFLFSSWEELVYHTVSQHRNGGLSCDICEDQEISFSNPAQLREHYFNEHQIGKQFQCKQCPKVFWSIRSLNDHKRNKKNCSRKLKHEATPHVLPIEGKIVSDLDYLRSEQKNDHDFSEISDDLNSEDEDVIPAKSARIQASPENQTTIDTCYLCKLKLHRREMLDHLKYHVGEEYLTRCPNSDCGFVCIAQEQLERHLEENKLCENTLQSGLNEFLKILRTCSECSTYKYIGARLCDLQKHLLEEHETVEKKFTCPISGCGMRFTLRRSLLLHLGRHDDVPKEQPCLQCSRKKTVQIGLEKMEAHLKEEHGAEQVVKCRKCPFLFSSWEELVDHIMLQHRHGKLSCDICDDAGITFVNPDQLQEHYFKEHQIGKRYRYYQCDQCLKKFWKLRSLNSHQRNHKSCVADPKLVCQFCSDTFLTRQLLLSHENEVHKGIVVQKEFRCKEPNCGKVFGKKGTLDKHHKCVHLRERKNHQCEHCKKSFFKPFMLESHMKSVHPGLQKHDCGTCGKAFATENALKEHKLIHSEERPFACDLGGNGFQQEEQLTEHLKVDQGKGTHQESP